MFSNTQSSSVAHINSQYSQYSQDFRIYVTDSKFHNCSRAIHSQASARVIVTNSDFFDITATGRGGVIYSTNSVTLTNCTIMNSTAIHGDGGAVYSARSVTNTNCSMINSYVTGYFGGAIYGREVTISDSILRGTAREVLWTYM